MYQGTNPFIDKYKLMEDVIVMLLPSYIRSTGKVKFGASILQEFRTMEVARATIVGVEDPAAEAVAYLDYHFKGMAKPFWYKQLTEAV
jgi:hypothetical protein